MRLILDQGRISKEGLRHQDRLQELILALNGNGKWLARLEADEEHQCWALILSTVGREFVEMRIDRELLGGSDFQALGRVDEALADFKTPPHRLEGKDRQWDFASLEDL